jgi:pimeloyl-ACP methyl ester carboxylesterase
MPIFERRSGPALYYEFDDYTDPWKDARHVMLIPGFARSSKFWQAWPPYLSRYYKIIRPDPRGVGRSSPDFDFESGIDLAAYVRDFKDLLDHLGVKEVHLCGESSAGTLSLALAAECPDRVRTLTVISAPVAMSKEDKESALAGYPDRLAALRGMGARGWIEASHAGRRFPADSDPRMLKWTLDEMAATDIELQIAMYKFTSTADAAPYLSRVRAPVLGLYPAGGVITNDEHLHALSTQVKDVRIVRVPSRSHSIQMTDARTCALQMLYFIAQHDGIACDEP